MHALASSAYMCVCSSIAPAVLSLLSPSFLRYLRVKTHTHVATYTSSPMLLDARQINYSKGTIPTTSMKSLTVVVETDRKTQSGLEKEKKMQGKKKEQTKKWEAEQDEEERANEIKPD